MNVKRLNLTLDKEVVEYLKQKGYNISMIVRTFLKEKYEQEKKKRK